MSLRRLTEKYNLNHGLQNLFLLSAALLIGFVLGEIILRVLGFSYNIFHEPDDITGRKAISNAEGWFNKEGRAYIKINSDGLRDHEHSKIKPEKVLRIAILGDSFTEALHVNIEDTFWSILEDRLIACKAFGNKKVEVINFGVSGFGTDQELLTLRHHVWDYSPDIVILAFYSGNDIRNNSKILEPYKLKPFFVLKDEKLKFDNSFINHPSYKWKTGIIWSNLRFLYPHSRILQLLAKFREIDFSFKLNNNNRNQVLFDYLYHTIFFEPINADWEQAWEITDKLLVKMRNEVEEKNARFVLVVLSNDIQVHPDAEKRQHFIKEMDILDLNYPDERIKDFAKKEGIEVLLLAPDFQRYAEKNNVFLHGLKNSPTAGFGHWNIEGHRLAGKIIAEYFRSDGI